jgi:hypothetical protein
MKRFTVASAVFSVSILAVWMIFQTYAASSARNNNSTVKAQPSHNEIMKAVNSGNEALIPVTGEQAKKVAPVFGTNGEVMSDPSGTILNAPGSGEAAIPVTGAERKVAPVFDANGAVLSDPSGAILNNGTAGSSDVQIAPVFDTNGAVVSDPSGTILNTSHP